MKVMGVDPGTRVVGYGIIQDDLGNLSTLGYGAIRANTKESIPQRLKHIYAELSSVIQEYSPEVLAIEKVFYGKNFQSAIKIGEGRGVALLAAANAEIPIYEYDATKVKKAVVGSGHAKKEQIQYMLQSILGLDEIPSPTDASDALAIALCHLQNSHLQELQHD